MTEDDRYIDVDAVAARAAVPRISELVDAGQLEDAYRAFIMAREKMRGVMRTARNLGEYPLQLLENYAQVGRQLARAIDAAPAALPSGAQAAATVWDATAKAYDMLAELDPAQAISRVWANDARRRADHVAARS
jgi:hypothetical protein